MHSLYRQQVLPISIEKAWGFFSAPKNLSIITPPDMNFQITHKPPGLIYKGMKITYKVRPFLKIPISWTTEITLVNQPYSFTDVQLKGPYQLWSHEHTFEPFENGVKMTDFVRYRLPLGILGNFAHTFFVLKRLNYIFEYRKRVLAQIFQDQSEIHIR